MRRDLRDNEAFRLIERLEREGVALGSGVPIAMTDLAISPDGRSLIASATVVDRLEGQPRSILKRLDLDLGAMTGLNAGDEEGRGAAWSPDGGHLAFIDTGKDPSGGCVSVLHTTTSRQVQIALAGFIVEYLRWSPNGRHLLLGVAEASADIAGVLGAYKLTGDDNLPAWMPKVEAGEDMGDWRALWLHDLESGATRRLSPEGVNVWEAC